MRPAGASGRPIVWSANVSNPGSGVLAPALLRTHGMTKPRRTQSTLPFTQPAAISALPSGKLAAVTGGRKFGGQQPDYPPIRY